MSEAKAPVTARFTLVASGDPTDLGLFFIFDADRERHDKYATGKESYPMVSVEGEARTTEAHDYAVELVALLNGEVPSSRTAAQSTAAHPTSPDLLDALEGEATLGLPAPEAQERLADDGADSARTEAVE